MSHTSPVKRFISCSSGYGHHGIGMHFAQLVEESRHAGELFGYAGTGIRKGDESIATVLPQPKKPPLHRITRIFTTPEQVYENVSRHYEEAIATGLPSGPNTLMTFAGRSLLGARKGRELGYETLELVSPTSHVNNAYKQHQKAVSLSNVNDSWLSKKTRDRILEEYEIADTIYVHSDYTMKSFLDEGIQRDKLKMTYLVPNPRFVPPEQDVAKTTFRIVYVGRIDSSKGIRVLIDAFNQMKNQKAELRIMGGWSSRPMKNYIQGEMARNPRITVGPGDPLPILHRASVLVHPTFEDGFAYAPLEALCCGVPVIVTEDTGMKQFVKRGKNGFVVPTGEVQPIVDSLNALNEEQLEFDANLFRAQFYTD